MKKIVLTLTGAIIFGWQGLSFATSSVDALIQKLEDKGILTDQDASQIKGEIAFDEQKSQQTTFKTMLPDWVNAIKITGDFRLRDQVQNRKVPGGGTNQAGNNFTQNRVLLRARLNFEDQINDKVKVVVGISTDGGNARATNYTLGGSTTANKDAVTFADSFGKPEIVLNKAYAVYTPFDWITVMGGKMDNPIWEAANASFFWDPDVTPEGGAIQVQKKLNDYITPFAQEVVLDIHDQTPTANTAPSTLGVRTDPYMMVSQAGIKGNLTDKVYYKAGVTWYDVNNPSHLIPGESLGINSTSVGFGGGNILKYSFNNIWVEGVDIGINDPFGDILPSSMNIPQVGVFGDFAENQEKGDMQNKAWEMGAYMGHPTLNGWGTWKLQSYYKTIERDSWLDEFPDNDFYSGDTNTKGWRTELDVGLAKNVWFMMTYFHTNIFKGITTLSNSTPSAMNTGSGEAPEDVYQMELNFKF